MPRAQIEGALLSMMLSNQKKLRNM